MKISNKNLIFLLFTALIAWGCHSHISAAATRKKPIGYYFLEELKQKAEGLIVSSTEEFEKVKQKHWDSFFSYLKAGRPMVATEEGRQSLDELARRVRKAEAAWRARGKPGEIFRPEPTRHFEPAPRVVTTTTTTTTATTTPRSPEAARVVGEGESEIKTGRTALTVDSALRRIGNTTPLLNREHLYEGELVRYQTDLPGAQPHITGFHVIRPETENQFVATLMRPDKFGSYIAQVVVGGKEKTSAIFPDSWSRKKIEKKIIEGFRNPLTNEQNRLLPIKYRANENRFIGKTREGMYLNMFFAEHPDGQVYINTVYPLYGAKEPQVKQISLSKIDYKDAWVILVTRLDGEDYVVLKKQGRFYNLLSAKKPKTGLKHPIRAAANALMASGDFGHMSNQDQLREFILERQRNNPAFGDTILYKQIPGYVVPLSVADGQYFERKANYALVSISDLISWFSGQQAPTIRAYVAEKEKQIKIDGTAQRLLRPWLTRVPREVSYNTDGIVKRYQ